MNTRKVYLLVCEDPNVPGWQTYLREQSQLKGLLHDNILAIDAHNLVETVLRIAETEEVLVVITASSEEKLNRRKPLLKHLVTLLGGGDEPDTPPSPEQLLNSLLSHPEIKGIVPVVMVFTDLTLDPDRCPPSVGTQYLPCPFVLSQDYTLVKIPHSSLNSNEEDKRLVVSAVKKGLDQIVKRNIEALVASADDELIGTSEAHRKVLTQINRAAPSDLNVLLLGETGTGKELTARAIHKKSKRSKGPFVAINCGTISNTLAVAELFGHEKGAFTDARELKLGCFELADKGTLFLDEIGELEPQTQVKLLRALEEKKITRVGGTKEIEVDIRVIAATNRNLVDAIKEHAFRKDLYYRLKTISIRLPTLSERREDTDRLAKYFLRQYSETTDHQLSFARSALGVLKDERWPGNIRQLRDIVRRAVLYCEGETITADNLKARLAEDEMDTGDLNLGDPVSMKVIEKRHIELILQNSGGNVTRAAQILGFDVTTVRRKIKEYGLKGPST